MLGPSFIGWEQVADEEGRTFWFGDLEGMYTDCFGEVSSG